MWITRTLVNKCHSLFAHTRGSSLGSRLYRMSSSDTRGDHLQRTAENNRQDVITKATVLDIKDISKTVKSLRLKVHDPKFFFKAGQWVDCFLPGLDKVGGYSMTSSPATLEKEGTLDLAVKYSTHPPAYWVHTKCQVGTEIAMRAGGDFYFDPLLADKDVSLLLVAGGVGVNPLYSILQEVVARGGVGGRPVPVSLLFSAGTQDELLFRDRLDTLANLHPEISCHYFVTQEQPTLENTSGTRLGLKDLESAVERLGKERVVTYICGPGPMIKDISKHLLNLQVAKERIIYETWW